MENTNLNPDEDIYFQCLKCYNTFTLFSEVETMFTITNESVFFIMDEKSFEEKSLIIDKENYKIADKSESDEEKFLEDLLYCIVKCAGCSKEIGKYILTVKENTQALLNKIIIHSDSMAYLKTGDSCCQYVNHNEFLKIELKPIDEEVKELRKLEEILVNAESDMNLLDEFQALDKYIDEGEEAMKKLIIAKNFMHSNYKG